MTYNHDFFLPERVDEQIEQLSQTEAPLIGDLKAYYRIEQQEDRASLERAWKRVSVRLPRNRDLSQSPTEPLPIPLLQAPQERMQQERTLNMRNHVSEVSREGNFSRRLSVLVAVLVAAVLVGSLIAIVNLSRNLNTASTLAVPTTHAPKALDTPTPMPAFGKTIYTTPANQWGFNGLSWSPDSKRVASSTVSTDGGVQFWDAATGGHLVTVQLLGGVSEWAYGLDWSPNSDDVAIATNQQVLIVNSQTGKIIRSHATSGQTASSSTSSDRVVFSNLAPTSGGYGYRATAWSPDGHLMASALSFGPYGEVQVWNPQTGATSFTLTGGTSENIGALSWSSDGKYIAATTWNTQGLNPMTQPSGKVWVWNVSTRQVVFQHSDFLSGSDTPVVWQHGSHNLAFVGGTSSGGKIISTLEIWNAETGKQVKQYVGTGTGVLAWSPDGTYLAYAGYDGKNPGEAVIIMDAMTGKQVYVHKGQFQSVGLIAWSPNGKYIVSAESLPQQGLPRQDLPQSKTVAEVWVA
jgi:WD40 repeat protein